MIKIRKKILVILVLGWLLTTIPMGIVGKQTINEKESNNDESLNFQDGTLFEFVENNGDVKKEISILYNEELMMDYSYQETCINYSNSPNDLEKEASGGLDLTVKNFKAWYSPPPAGYEGIYKYRCIYWEIWNIGDEYSGDYGWINVSQYLVYPDGSEHKNFEITVFTSYKGKDRFLYGSMARSFLLISNDFYYDKIRVEIETTLPDSNLENNVKSVDPQEGVTVWGRVYEQDLFGNKKTVNEALIYLNSEYDKLGLSYGFGTKQFSEPVKHDWYTQVAPKNPDKKPFRFRLTAFTFIGLLLKIKTKFTDPLVSMDYREIFFTFLKLNGKSIPQSIPSVHQINTQQSSTIPTTTTTTTSTTIR